MVYLLTVKCKVFQILTYIRHERPTERYCNTVKDGFFYQIPLPRRMKNHIPRARLDDTAIPHTKIKITEIPLEKKAQYRNTVNPHVPLTCLQCQGFIFCQQNQNLGTLSMHRIGFIVHLMINENHHHARCCHLYIKQLVIHTMSSAFTLWSVGGWVGRGG